MCTFCATAATAALEETMLGKGGSRRALRGDRVVVFSEMETGWYMGTESMRPCGLKVGEWPKAATQLTIARRIIDSQSA